MSYFEEVESPENYEPKCLCVLVLDVSGSMTGRPIEQLNKGLQTFHQEVMQDFVASNRLEVSIVIFSSQVQCIQEPALITNVQMPKLTTGGTTRMAEAIQMAIEQIDSRKQWYKNTGQKYYRPMIVLMTDGEPDRNQNLAAIGQSVQEGVSGKHFSFYAIGVQGYNHQKLAQICPPNVPPLPLDGYKFSDFFKWLSNSIGTITKSRQGDTIALPPVSGWTQTEV